MYLSVNNINWKVEFVRPTNVNLLTNQNIYTLGMTDNTLKTIFLSDTLSGELLYKVLCHELVHVYCFSYNIYMDIQQEEYLAQFISDYGKSIVTDTEHLLQLILHTNIAL